MTKARQSSLRKSTVTVLGNCSHLNKPIREKDGNTVSCSFGKEVQSSSQEAIDAVPKELEPERFCILAEQSKPNLVIDRLQWRLADRQSHQKMTPLLM